MQISFMPQNYTLRASAPVQKMSFKGIDDINIKKAEIYAELDALCDENEPVSPNDKINTINSIATRVFNDPNLIDECFVEKAIKAMPVEDERYSAARYATELMRLARYCRCYDEKKEIISEAIKMARADAPSVNRSDIYFDNSRLHFNVANQSVNNDGAHYSKPHGGNRYNRHWRRTKFDN